MWLCDIVGSNWWKWRSHWQKSQSKENSFEAVMSSDTLSRLTVSIAFMSCCAECYLSTAVLRSYAKAWWVSCYMISCTTTKPTSKCNSEKKKSFIKHHSVADYFPLTAYEQRFVFLTTSLSSHRQTRKRSWPSHIPQYAASTFDVNRITVQLNWARRHSFCGDQRSMLWTTQARKQLSHFTKCTKL